MYFSSLNIYDIVMTLLYMISHDMLTIAKSGCGAVQVLCGQFLCRMCEANYADKGY